MTSDFVDDVHIIITLYCLGGEIGRTVISVFFDDVHDVHIIITLYCVFQGEGIGGRTHPRHTVAVQTSKGP